MNLKYKAYLIIFRMFAYLIIFRMFANNFLYDS